MNKATYLAAIATIALIPQTANAQGFLDRLESTVSKVENTVTRTENTVNRAQGTAERLNNKIPESGAEEPAETVTYEPAPAPAPTADTPTAAEEEEILRRAREIEERSILQQAEEIQRRRNNPQSTR